MLNHTIVGAIAPNTSPDHLGQNYLNSVTGTWYKAKGYASSSDWVIVSNGPSEVITLSGDTIKEFTLDLTNATKFKIESWGNNSGTGSVIGIIQFYCNGAWVTSNYVNDTGFLTSSPSAGLNVATESGIRFNHTESANNNTFSGEFHNSSTEIFGMSTLSIRSSPTSIRFGNSTVAVSGVATKCRLNIPSGTVTGNYKLTILG